MTDYARALPCKFAKSSPLTGRGCAPKIHAWKISLPRSWFDFVVCRPRAEYSLHASFFGAGSDEWCLIWRLRGCGRVGMIFGGSTCPLWEASFFSARVIGPVRAAFAGKYIIWYRSCAGRVFGFVERKWDGGEMRGNIYPTRVLCSFVILRSKLEIVNHCFKINELYVCVRPMCFFHKEGFVSEINTRWIECAIKAFSAQQLLFNNS